MAAMVALRSRGERPRDMQVVYGMSGERELTELTVPWLKGHEGSSPVRVGNQAASQFQLDVYGEVIDALQLSRAAGLDPDLDAWNFERALLDYLSSAWKHPDSGIWEMRGPRLSMRACCSSRSSAFCRQMIRVCGARLPRYSAISRPMD